jgi:hypothetical protein
MSDKKILNLNQKPEIVDNSLNTENFHKILIYLPESKRKLIASIPLIQIIKKNSSTSILYLISDIKYKDTTEHLIRLGSDVDIFYLDQNEFGGWGGIHRFCYNLKEVFNINLFISLEPTMQKNSIGYFFKSNKRVGIGNKVTSLLLNDFLDIKKEPGLNKENNTFSNQTYLKLLNFTSISKDVDSDENFLPKKELLSFNKLNIELIKNYILISYHSFMNNESIWIEIIENSFQKNFVLIGESKDDIYANKFIEKIKTSKLFINNKNKVRSLITRTNYLQNLILITNSSYVIGPNDYILQLSQIFRSPCSIIMKDQKDIKHLSGGYFKNQGINLFYEEKIQKICEESKKTFDLKEYDQKIKDIVSPRIFYINYNAQNTLDSINKHLEDIEQYIDDEFST